MTGRRCPRKISPGVQRHPLANPYLKRPDAGVVIIMSSVGGRPCYPNRSPCAVTKLAL